MKVRQAKSTDLARIVALGRVFHKEMSHYLDVPFEDEKAFAYAENFVRHPEHFASVA